MRPLLALLGTFALVATALIASTPVIADPPPIKTPPVLVRTAYAVMARLLEVAAEGRWTRSTQPAPTRFLNADSFRERSVLNHTGLRLRPAPTRSVFTLHNPAGWVQRAKRPT